jgi:parallel beta-helix repeat protein
MGLGMRKAGKILGVTGVFIILLVAVLVWVPQVHAQTSPEMNQLRAFFGEVLMIDTSACTISDNPLSYSDNRPELGTRGVMEGKVTLTFENGRSVEALYEFKGTFLVWCLVYYDQNNSDPLPYIKPPSNNSVEQARQFLENYEKFTNDSSFGDMAKLLDGVKNSESLNKTVGNLKLAINSNGPYFDWSYTFEGEDYRLLSISFASPPHIFTYGYQGWRYNMDSSAVPVYQPITSSGVASSAEPDAWNSFLSSSLSLQFFAVIAFACGVAAIFLVQLYRRTACKVAKYKRLSRLRIKISWLTKKRLLSAVLILLVLTLCSGWNGQLAQGNFMYPPLERIYITSDGSLTPSGLPINRTDDVYTLTGPITNRVIVVQRDNIVIDGASFLIQKTTPALGRQDAVGIENRSNVTVKNLLIEGFNYGVFVSNSSNCIVTQNTFSGNDFGVVLANQSMGNSVIGNSLTSGGGIAIYYSPDNILRSNTMVGSGPNLWIDCEAVTAPSAFVNDIDSSNTVNDKPVCYWIGQHDRVIPAGTGYVGLINCNGITVQNLNLTNNGQGLLLINTDNSVVSGNTFIDNSKAIAVYSSKNNSFTSNSLIHNQNGITLCSRPNMFTNNQLTNNTVDANFEDRFFDEFDRSNIVDGEPICYWLWQKDKAVPVDSGYVVLLSCQNITVQGLVVTGRRQAMLLSEVTNSTITKNALTNNDQGILLAGSANNQITRNLIANNTYGIQMVNSVSNNVSANRLPFNVNFGIQMDDCSNNKVTDNYISHGKQGLVINRGDNNTITGNSIFYTKEKGVHLGESTHNLFTCNTIAWSNGFGLTITGEVGDNCLYHNNFVNNAGNDPNQAYPGANTPNTWDNGCEGNFLSDYQNKYPTAKQVNGSGVWDTAVVMKGSNVDNFPLVNPVTMTYEVILLQPTN